MKKILIIEPDSEYREPLQDAFDEMDGDFELIFFDDIKSFFRWVKKTVRPGPDDVSDKPNNIALIIGHAECLTKVDTALLEKTQKMFIHEKLCEEANPVRFIVSSFDHSDFNISEYFHPIISNIVYKPYDKLLIKEQLKFALEGRKALTSSLYSHKTSSNVELIKGVRINVITELGFRTISSQEIPLGKVSRYYSELFEGESLDYVFAYCYRCSKNSDNKYDCSFAFFGISPDQLSAIRRNIHKSDKHASYPLESTSYSSDVSTVVFIHKNPDVFEKAQSIIEECFSNINMVHFSSFHQLNQYLPPEQQAEEKVDAGEVLLEKADQFKVYFSITGETIKAVHTVVEEAEQVLEDFLTVPLSGIKKIKEFFKSFMNEKDYKEFSNYLTKNKEMSKNTIELSGDTETATVIKVESVKEVSHKDYGETKEFIFRELSKDEIFKLRKRQGVSFEHISAVFVDNSFFEKERMAIVKTAIGKLMGKPSVEASGEKKQEAKSDDSDNTASSVLYFGVNKDPILSYEMLEKLSHLDDYMTLPLDNFYLSRKLKQMFPQWILKSGKQLNREGYELDVTVNAAMPVQIDAVSESLMTFLYSRKLIIGDIRKFVLSMPGVKNNPEITAMCNFSEPADAGMFKCYFVFIGIRDLHLKHIRKWEKDEYIKAKQSS